MSAEVLWMVRFALACPRTVECVILISVACFPVYSSNCVRILEDWVL